MYRSTGLCSSGRVQLFTMYGWCSSYSNWCVILRMHLAEFYMLENVEHCGGEPEQADNRDIMSLMSDVTSSKFKFNMHLSILTRYLSANS